MSCNCIKTVKTTAVVDLGTALVLVINPTTFKKRERFRLVICQTIPITDPATNPQVLIFDGTNTFLVFNKLSEFVRRTNVVCRQCYDALASSDPLHIQLYGISDNCYCPNEIVTPTAAGTAIADITLDVVLAGLVGLELDLAVPAAGDNTGGAI